MLDIEYDKYNLNPINDPRRRDEPRTTFYNNMKIRSVSFEKPYTIKMKSGIFEGEKITFYKNGGIKKIFPLDGKISGFWTEEDEYKLAKEYTIRVKEQIFRMKPICFSFYKDESIKSITLWPNERIDVKVGYLNISTRIGVSFYKNGNIKSCEPSKSTIINTPIGEILAYDANAIGITGDKNSLNFYEDGSLKSLITSDNVIVVINKKNNNKVIYSPKFIKKFALDIVTKDIVKIEFIQNKIIINNLDEYDLDKYEINIEKYMGNLFNLK